MGVLHIDLIILSAWATKIVAETTNRKIVLKLTAAQLRVMEGDDWFGGLTQNRRTSLLVAGNEVRLASGGRIYGSGDASNGLWAVVDGEVRLQAYPARGAEVLIRILTPGSWFGELSTLDGRPRPQDAFAFTPSTVINISQATLAQLAERDPAFYRDLGLLVCKHQREALAFIGQRVSQPIPVRVANALLYASREAGYAPLAIMQAEMAVIVGVSRQTVNKELKSLERAGVIRIKYRGIEILDRSLLQALGAEDLSQQ